MTQLLKQDPDDKALKGILEIFSGSGEIVNMGDLLRSYAVLDEWS